MDPTESELARCMHADAVRFRRALKRGADPDGLKNALQHSQRLREQRRQRAPRPRFDPALPIHHKREDIAAAIRDHQVVVVCGETGSGKSTQLPQICLTLGRGIGGYIGHTQPRRIAARSVANRVAEELGTRIGESVGFKVRFRDRTGDGTHIKIMTDGILLAEIEHDRHLNQYDTLIIDEAHERSLNIDFLLGYCKWMLPRRPDLKLIITSATIDPKRFSGHFDDAPVIEVSGRMYPVETRYRPFDDADTERGERNMFAAMVKAIDELCAVGKGGGPGDILVFLPGEREIHELETLLTRKRLPHTDILPLYARLSAARQQKIFAPHSKRRIILSTNVAETSLTVPGVRYVVDSGLARISRYRPGRQVQALPVEPISRASADQRQGRCGRTANGICIRMYSETDFQSRPAFGDPEILRTSLAAVILKMRYLGLGTPEEFAFIDPPSTRMINDGYRLLEELGAVDPERRLTGIGRRLARLPVDPRIARMLLAAGDLGCLNEMLIIGAALAVQDPWVTPRESRQRAAERHAKHRAGDNDFLAYLRLWTHFNRATAEYTQRQTRNYCLDEFLSYVRMREWREVWMQLKTLTERLKLPCNEQPAPPEKLHQALIAGLLGNIGWRRERGEYLGARDKKFHIHPGSAAFKRPPKWMLCAELVDTTRLYARTVGRIEPEWIEPMAAHLLRKSYLEPHWDDKRGQVVAYEQVSLYGLVIIPRRRVHYGPVAPDEAREIFIRAALIEGRLRTPAPFLKHNLRLVREIEALESRARRRDILVDEEDLFAFYDRHIPADVYTARGFEHWRRDAERAQPELLRMPREILMRRDATEITVDRFPKQLDINGNRLPLRYRFDPGHPNDGVTVRVPLGLHTHLPRAPFTWLVPGLLLERIIALIKSLPKPVRRKLAPAPDSAERLLGQMDEDEKSLTDSLADAITAMTGMTVTPGDWDESKLAPHLSMNFEIVGPDGEVVAGGRDMDALCAELAARDLVAPEPDTGTGLERDHIRTWDFGDLPETVPITRNGFRLTGYPAIVRDAGGLGIRVLEAAAEADRRHRLGVGELLLMQLPAHARQLRKPLNLDRMCLNFYGVGTRDALRRDLTEASVQRIIQAVTRETIRTRVVFEQCVDAARAQLIEASNELCALVDRILTQYRALRTALDDCYPEARLDLQGQLEGLVFPGFVSATPGEWLQHLPRYLEAAMLRIQRMQHALPKDRKRLNTLKPHSERLRVMRESGVEPGVYRWLLEEYRVSLFAQQLGTRHSVSDKRLEQLWSSLQQVLKNRG